MSADVKCRCQSCLIRSLQGPAVLITIGVLYLLQEMHSGRLHFGSTWPLILLVIGLIQLASATASREGHSEPAISQGIPTAAPPAPVTPPQSFPPAQGR